MTPLGEALTAAQRASLKTLEAAYVAGHIEADDMTMHLLDCGITDRVDLVFLIAALDVLREWGVAAPAMTERVAAEEEQATDKQLDYITRLFAEGKAPGQMPPDHVNVLTKAQASEVIDQLQKGTYSADKWSVPF